MTQKQTEHAQLSTSSVGRHSELLAMAALIAEGWSVLEPTIPEAYDLLAIKDGRSLRIQVKTIKERERCGSTYYVIKGLKNSGKVYDLDDCDAFVGVVDGRVYMTECRGIWEYWCRADHANEKWTELSVHINSEKGTI